MYATWPSGIKDNPFHMSMGYVCLDAKTLNKESDMGLAKLCVHN